VKWPPRNGWPFFVKAVKALCGSTSWPNAPIAPRVTTVRLVQALRSVAVRLAPRVRRSGMERRVAMAMHRAHPGLRVAMVMRAVMVPRVETVPAIAEHAPREPGDQTDPIGLRATMIGRVMMTLTFLRPYRGRSLTASLAMS
jgi:hypothetical protein